MSLGAFANEPVLELRRSAERERLTGALRELDARLPLAVPVRIGGDDRAGEDLPSTDPGRPERVVGLAAKATEADVDAAVAAASAAQAEWAARGAHARAAVLVSAAARLRERRLELAALAVRECAKPWAEADADVCEAVDFLEYYAREAIALDDPPELLQMPGERNSMRYAPRGVCAVIAPWNFPLAIACGMVSAALAAGNAVVLKPAEQSPTCAFAVCEALWEAGVPGGALAFLPGEGDAGAALVRHPGVQVIAFTGSAAVGLEIVEAAAKPADGQHHLKRVVAEMGGKNCVIVDSDADLDDVVPALIASAFAYGGQKCSAAARVLAHEAIATPLMERLAGAAAVLIVGQAETFGTLVPPVIEREAQARVDGYAAAAESEGRILASAGPSPEDASAGGWFCRATVAAGLDPDAAVLREEVFGPLLTVEAVGDVDAACELVDALPFALTGGLFSRSPATIERVVARSPVGNLYVNRAITGAMVARQPFGGNRLSGTGTKAGGPGYLLQFVEPRVVSENTVRHGLVVD
jgi:RHH-type proline utilization regulon transcriptional repressor/proline dehydrogenase/delta 1-pyrroline-5-carboxylate dehydrogenase